MISTLTKPVGRLIGIFALTLGIPLGAETVSVQDTGSQVVSDNSCFTRPLTVPARGEIQNVTFELHIDHTYRGDLSISLVSPDNTLVYLAKNNGQSSNNLHVLFLDSAGTSITTDYQNHSSTTTVERKPRDPLSKFQSESSNGTWELKICDTYSGDTGTYYSSTLTIDYIASGPTAVDDSADTNEDQSVSIDVLANDHDNGEPLDPSTVTVTDAPGHGSYTIDSSTGRINYTPNADYNGNDQLRYTVSDSQGAVSNEATVSITVNPVNDAPVAGDDTVTTDEDTPVTIQVLNNDTDVDGDPLSLDSAGTPSHGSVNINGNQIEYTPDRDYSGTDSFSYTVTDGTESATATVTITITPVNDAPVARDDTVTTDEDTPITISVLSNDSDPEGDTLILVGANGASHGSLSTANGTVTYTPESDFYGTDSFSYTVSDGTESATATVSVTVTPVNDAPVAGDDTASTGGNDITLNLLTNDSDPDGDTLHVISTTDPRLGTVTINSDDTVTYTPEAPISCSDSFDYTISDGNATDTATVTITSSANKPLGGDLQIENRDAPSPDPVAVGQSVTFTLTTRNRVRATRPDVVVEIRYNQDVSIVDAYQFDPYTTAYGYVCDKRSGTLPAGEKITCTKNTNWGSITNHKDLKIIVQPTRGDLLVQHAVIYSTADDDPDCSNNSATASVNIPPITATDDTYIIYRDDNLSGNLLSNDYGDTLQIVETSPDVADISGLNLNSDGTFSYHPDTNTTQISFLYTVEDSQGRRDSARVTITVLPHEGRCSKPHAFENRYTDYVPGDLVAIGNSNVCADIDRNGRCDADQRKRNDISNIIHANIYSSPELNASGQPEWLQNVSGAVLDLPPGAKVVWAGLYWHGEVWNFKTDTPELITSAGIDTGKLGLEKMSREDHIQFKVPGGDYQDLRADEHYYFFLQRKEPNYNTPSYDKSITYGYGYVKQLTGTAADYNASYELDFSRKERYEEHYQGFTDVTGLLKSVEAARGSANGEYWVGNIQASVGRLRYPGVEAAWTLQVVYTLPNAQPRSIAITDGYVGLYGTAQQGDDYARTFGCPTGGDNTGIYRYTVDFDIRNLMTPKKEGFTTDMTVFVTESDPEDSSTTEYLKITKKDGSEYLVDGYNAWNYEIKKKDGSDNLDRTPAYIYPIGMTLKNYRMTDALSPDQNNTHVTFSTDTDRLILGVIGFATDMRAPQLCYDYDLRIGEYRKVDVDANRTFEVNDFNGDPLQIKLLIRNQEADFDFENARLFVTFEPEEGLRYRINQSEISPEGTFTYLHVDDINSSRGEIPIGKDAGPQGGTLDSSGGSTYVKQYFDIENGYYRGRFDIHVEGNVSYIPGEPPVGYHLSTAIPEGRVGHIPRCPRNPVYDPIYGYFNIEKNGTDPRHDSELKRFSLPTQISGRRFAVQLVSYSRESNYSTPIESNATVEVEIIDISAFDNNSTVGYDVSCEEPSSLGRGKFLHFDHEFKTTMTIGKEPGDYDFSGQPDLVLRNAAFRIWSLMIDLNSSDPSQGKRPLDHNCMLPPTANQSPTCFRDLYDRYYSTPGSLTQRNCENNCTSNAPDAEEQCYVCLRTFAGRPVCSRDNFSIRPALFRVEVYDDNLSLEVNASRVNEPDGMIQANDNRTMLRLIAQYAYPSIIKARNYQDNQNADQYYRSFPPTATDRNATVIPDSGASCSFTSLKKLSTFTFYNSRAWQFNALIGAMHRYVRLSSVEAGRYHLALRDSGWTLVDHANYPYQTRFRDEFGVEQNHTDCRLGKSDTNSSLAGCDISSHVSKGDSPRSKEYVDLDLAFYPDRFEFNLTGAGVDTQPDPGQNWIYMNDLANADAQNSIDSTMAVSIRGSILAKGAAGSVLGNYTSGCFAQKGIFRMEYKTEPDAPHTADTLSPVDFQQYFYDYGSNLSLDDADGNITLNPVFFPDDHNGTAPFDLYSNLQRPDDHMVNVTTARYKKLYFVSPDSQAYGYAQAAHIPRGEQNLDKNITFYYATVAPDRAPTINRHFYRVLNAGKWQGRLKVRVYCEDDNITNCTMLSELDQTSSEPDPDQNGSWYLMGAHESSQNHGQVTNLSIVRGGHATLTPSGALSFSNGVSTADVVVTYPLGQPRPYQVDVNVSADPWLSYGPDRNFTIYFEREKLRWRGKGKTGHVIQTEPGTHSSERINW